MIHWLEQRPLLRFVLGVLGLLPAAFLVWYFLGSAIAAPAVMIIKPVLLGWLPQVIDSMALQGTDLMVLARFGELDGAILAAEQAGNQLGYPVNTRSLSYSIPFFTALYFATPMRGGIDRYCWCLLILWGLLALGLIGVTLKNLMLGLGSVFLEQAYVPPADAIALLYQLSTLMVPPLAPVILWAYVARDSTPFAQLLPPSLRPAQRSD